MKRKKVEKIRRCGACKAGIPDEDLHQAGTIEYPDITQSQKDEK